MLQNKLKISTLVIYLVPFLIKKSKTMDRCDRTHYQKANENLSFIKDVTRPLHINKAKQLFINCLALLKVPTTGFEPAHPKAHAPQACTSTNFATWAGNCDSKI